MFLHPGGGVVILQARDEVLRSVLGTIVGNLVAWTFAIVLRALLARTLVCRADAHVSRVAECILVKQTPAG